MTLSLQSLARTIAKVHGGTDADWLEYMDAAEAARGEVVDWVEELLNEQRDAEQSPIILATIRALIAQPDGAPN